MLIGVEGCENVAEEARLLLIISSKFAQTGIWTDVADAVSEAASDPEAATPVPVLNAQECEDSFRALCHVLTLDDDRSDKAKAAQISESLRLKRLQQIQSNIRILDDMIGVLESDEALLDDQDSMLDLAQIEQHLSSAKDLFFLFPKAVDLDCALTLVPPRESTAQAGPSSEPEAHQVPMEQVDIKAPAVEFSNLPRDHSDPMNVGNASTPFSYLDQSTQPNLSLGC